MKIAMVAEHGGPRATLSGADDAGQDAYVSAVSAALARRGHRVDVYTRRNDPDVPDRVETPHGYTVVQVPAGPTRHMPGHEQLAHMRAFAQFLKATWATSRPDVAHSHSWTLGVAAQLAARHLDLPAVHTFHTFGAHKRRRHLEAMVARSATNVSVTYTDAVAEVLQMGRCRSGVSVIPHGVDLDLFTSQGAAPARNSRRRIVSIGKILPNSGFDVVIQALPGIPSADFTIVGSPGASDVDTEAEARRLRDLATCIGVADRVSISESIAQQDIPELIRSADVIACTPSCASFGTVALEAMACGVPVVATDVGGLRDTVVHEVTGYLVPLHRLNEVNTAINRLMRDEFLRQSLGGAGRDRVTARYAWDRVAGDTVRLYERAVSRGCTYSRAS